MTSTISNQIWGKQCNSDLTVFENKECEAEMDKDKAMKEKNEKPASATDNPSTKSKRDS